MRLTATCCECGSLFEREANYINRARRIGANVYCNRACAGLSRRRDFIPTSEQAKAAKAAYDANYRRKKAAVLKEKKAAWYQRTADREKEREYRKANMHKHVAYCQRPEYREWKSAYDTRHRAKKQFGEFAPAALLLLDLEKEILAQASRYEIYSTNGLLNKAQTRRRAL